MENKDEPKKGENITKDSTSYLKTDWHNRGEVEAIGDKEEGSTTKNLSNVSDEVIP